MWTYIPPSDLRLSIIQPDLHWHQPEKNRAMFADLMSPLNGETDLIVLPEMFTSGFTIEPDYELAESENTPTTKWMIQQSSATGAALCGSIVFKTESGALRNRLLFVTPDGSVEYYDKTHLFRMAGEHERYEQGTERKVVVYKGWRILLTICYDLRFPVFMRNTGDYDLAVCVANWPAARRIPWITLLKARAIENSCFVAGVNRVGQDGNAFEYAGDSMLTDYYGHELIGGGQNEPFVKTATLEAEKIAKFRERFPTWQDSDRFKLDGF